MGATVTRGRQPLVLGAVLACACPSGVRVPRTTVAVFRHGQRIASHVQYPFHGRDMTVAAHVPAAHPEAADWNAPTLTARVEAVGRAAPCSLSGC